MPAGCDKTCCHLQRVEVDVTNQRAPACAPAHLRHHRGPSIPKDAFQLAHCPLYAWLSILLQLLQTALQGGHSCQLAAMLKKRPAHQVTHGGGTAVYPPKLKQQQKTANSSLQYTQELVQRQG